jgi:hypothetical protein
MVSEKARVISVSRTNITSIQHPKSPFFVLLLEDENGNKWIQKSKKEYRPGEELILKPDKNAVALWRIKYDALEAIEKLIFLLGGLELGPETKALVLPTLDSPKHPYFSENTNPKFLDALLDFLMSRGVKNIKVVGQSFDEIPIEASVQKSQLLEVCQRRGVLPFDLAKGSFIKKQSGLEISSQVFENDLIINLPILKSGRASASENLLKLLKKESYLGSKYLSSDQELIEKLIRDLPGILTLADAEFIQKPNRFTTFLGLVMAGFNVLHLDRAFNEIVSELPEFLKNIQIDDVIIVGRELDEVKCKINDF